MTASADAVKELRDRTGAGMMDCKAALVETAGNIEQAIDLLRKKGMASAAKRAGRDAKEGLIVAKVDGKKAALVEANCETDFVARTEDFKALAISALEAALTQGEAAISSEKITQRLAEMSGKIGEKMLVRRAKVVNGEGTFFSYIHSNNKLGVIVELTGKQSSQEAFQQLGKDLAMQIAASNPLCLSRDQVPADVIEREKNIYKEEVKGKPDNIVEKILAGKLDKFYQANCLIEQPFIKDDKVSVKKLVEETGKKLGDAIQIKQYVRFQLGENTTA